MNKETKEAMERAARIEGREAVAMPVISRSVARGLDLIIYGAEITSDVLWNEYPPGNFHIFGEYRLLDLGPQAAYTAIQNQIDRLQADQQTLLAAAFETGPQVMQEHLEAVQAAGERAVERLNTEAK